MKISNLIKTYNLIGSLLEAIQIDINKKTITLTLDFCYWQQKDYNDKDTETGIVALIFYNYTEYDISRHIINSDEIVNIKTIDSNTIDICVESDITGKYHHIKISALNVELMQLWKD